MVMMCHNKGLPIFRPEDKPADSTSSRRVGCALRARKSPAGERGSSEVNRFSTTGLPPGRSQRHGQDDTGSSIGGATDETPSRAIGFCVGRPTRKSPAEAGLSQSCGPPKNRRKLRPTPRQYHSWLRSAPHEKAPPREEAGLVLVSSMGPAEGISGKPAKSTRQTHHRLHAARGDARMKKPRRGQG